jgi:hypothetical protein
MAKIHTTAKGCYNAGRNVECLDTALSRGILAILYTTNLIGALLLVYAGYQRNYSSKNKYFVIPMV